jgi:hypothetical protein
MNSVSYFFKDESYRDKNGKLMTNYVPYRKGVKRIIRITKPDIRLDNFSASMCISLAWCEYKHREHVFSSEELQKRNIPVL